jgi:hypothetical protein
MTTRTGANDDRYSARYVDPMIGPEAPAATMRPVPRLTSRATPVTKGPLRARRRSIS